MQLYRSLYCGDQGLMINKVVVSFQIILHQKHHALPVEKHYKKHSKTQDWSEISGVSSSTHTTQCIHIEILINHLWTFTPGHAAYVGRR